MGLRKEVGNRLREEMGLGKKVGNRFREEMGLRKKVGKWICKFWVCLCFFFLWGVGVCFECVVYYIILWVSFTIGKLKRKFQNSHGLGHPLAFSTSSPNHP
jgi:hypothetical protein